MRKITYLVLSIMLLLLIPGCSSQGPAGAMGGAPETAVTVSVQEIETGSIIETYYAVGTLKAEQEYEVSSDARGNVENIYVNEGDLVSPGDVLFTVDYTDDINDLQISQKKSEMSVELNRINMENILVNYNRSQELFDAGIIAQSDLENAELSYKQAKLTYEQSQASLESITNQLNSANNDARVISTISGTVGSIEINKGESYSGATAMTIVDTNTIIVQTQVSDKIINKCAVGQQASIYIPSISENALAGKVKSISVTKDDLSSSYPVKIEIEKQGISLKVGMYAEVYLEIDKHDNAIIIPKQAVLTEDDLSYVFLADGDKAKRVELTIGLTEGENVEVIGDIKAGDLLIIEGQKFVDDGQAILIPGRTDDEKANTEQMPAQDNPGGLER